MQNIEVEVEGGGVLHLALRDCRFGNTAVSGNGSHAGDPHNGESHQKSLSLLRVRKYQAGSTTFD